MKLSANEIKLNGLRARNCVTIQQALILKICLRAQKVSGSFEKRAPGSLTVYQPIQIIVTTNKSLCSFFLIPHLFSHPAKPVNQSLQQQTNLCVVSSQLDWSSVSLSFKLFLNWLPHDNRQLGSCNRLLFSSTYIIERLPYSRWPSTDSTDNRAGTHRVCCLVPLSLTPQQRRSLIKRKPQVILGIAKTTSLSSSCSPVSLTAINGRALGTDSHRTISKRSSECWLLIGHNKCFVLFCPIGEQHLEFFSYVRTRRLFSRHTFLSGSFIGVVRARETFLFYYPNHKLRNYRWVGKTFRMLSAGAFLTS